MTKRFKLPFFFISLLILASCGANQSGPSVNGPAGAGGNDGTGGGGNVAGLKVAPHYQINQFKKGQWIAWQRSNANNEVECIRWIWQEVGANTNVIKGEYSADCKEWDARLKRMIYFNPKTGAVVKDQFYIGGSSEDSPHPKMESIFTQLYGNQNKVSFTEDKLEVGDQKFAFFEIQSKPSLYLNHPGHPFHAVALYWIEKEDSTKWDYVAFSSDPSLPAIKE